MHGMYHIIYTYNFLRYLNFTDFVSWMKHCPQKFDPHNYDFFSARLNIFKPKPVSKINSWESHIQYSWNISPSNICMGTVFYFGVASTPLSLWKWNEHICSFTFQSSLHLEIFTALVFDYDGKGRGNLQTFCPKFIIMVHWRS